MFKKRTGILIVVQLIRLPSILILNEERLMKK
jgi:hypothetical protein